MATTSKRDTFNKVVNFDRENNEITVLEYVFEYDDGMRGATGYVLRPVSRAEYEEKISFKSVKKYLKEIGDLPEEYEDSGYNEFAQALIDRGEAEDFVFDLSFNDKYDEIREACGLDEENAYLFDCVGRGRCFGPDYQGNINPELSEIIREYEA